MPHKQFLIPNDYSQHYARRLQQGFGLSGIDSPTIPVFRGMPYQKGAGFGSFFASVARFIAPV
jgi:hypothetical protein